MEIGALGTCLTGSGPTVFGLFSPTVTDPPVPAAELFGDVDVFSVCPYP
jgi:hypothetical protein